MRYIKIMLVALLVVVGALYASNEMNRRLSGVEVPPTIRCDSDVVEVSVRDEDAMLLAGVTASDKQDGDLTADVRVQGISKLITDNTAKVTYIVFDSHGNAASCSRTLRYTDYTKPHFTIESPLVYSENEEIQLLDRLSASDSVDGDLTKAIRVSNLSATSDPDVRMVTVQVTNSMGDTTRLDLPIVIHTGVVVRPDVYLKEYLIYIDQGSKFDPDRYLDSVDTPIGPGDTDDVKIQSNVDTDTPGTYYVYYRYPYSVTSGLSVLTVVVR